MLKRNRAIQAASILLGVAGLLVIFNACGGSTASVPTATAIPTAVPTRPANPTATSIPPTAVPTAIRPAATATQQATAATPTTVATVAPAPTGTRAPTATTAAATATAKPANTTTPAAVSPATVVNVDILADPYIFAPDKFTFQAGKKYLLKLNGKGDAHTFTVAGLGLDVFIPPNTVVEKEVSFVDVGTYKLVCIIHEQLNQTGTVVVTPG